jgi:DNA-binding transcriptional MerR regulator
VSDADDDANDGPGFLAIGAFSRASLLSIKALRAYHESGLLVPARVDPRTGYRTYDVSQLTDAAVVRRLRDLDLPLGQVREVLVARDPAVTRRVLDAHAAVMRARLDDVTRIVAELQEGVERPTAHTPVHVRRVPAVHALSVRGTVSEADFADFLGGAYAALHAVAATAGLVPSGPAGALYPPEIVGDGPEPCEAFVPVAAPAPLPEDRGDVVLTEVPAATVAVIEHAGAYDAIDGTYRLLGAWVAAHARPAAERVREIYVVSWGDTDDPARFRTEIHWPIDPVDGPTPEETP